MTTKVSETRVEYSRPYRPGPIRWVNRALAPLGAIAARLDPAKLMEAARRKVGTDDFGDASFVEPLGVLCRAIDEEARLHPVGRVIAKERLVSALCNRLRVESYLAAHPGAQTTPIERPIVIVGMQRTGTTLLHRLLAADPRNRSLASWEALAPVPNTSARDGADPRVALAKRSERALSYMAPDFFAIHPVEADAPEEDVLLLDLAFRSTVPEATMNVPTYAAWLEQQDSRDAYRYERRLLGLLTHAQPPGGGRWVLKTPHHLEWLEALEEVLPDAVIVWTHRDPVTTIASFCSMVAHGRGVFSDHVDPHLVGRQWLRKVERMVARGMDARTRSRCTFIDVRYEDLVADPMKIVAAIRSATGDEATPSADDAIRSLLAVQTQHKHGVHKYALADFGIEAGEVRERFAAYRERYCR